MTAKSHGLDEECQAILEATGATEDQLTLPKIGTPLATPKPVVPTFKTNWPTKASSQSFFEKALLGQVEGLSLEDEPAAANGMELDDGMGDDVVGKQAGGAMDEDDVDVAGWDMGDDAVPEVDDFVNVDSAEAGGAGSSEADLWARNSPLAVDHVAGGSFESAMQLLNRQVGAVSFAPLKPRFLEVYQASKTFLPAAFGLPPLTNYIRRTLDETDPRKVLPIVPRDLEQLAANDLQKGYAAMKGNKLEDGLRLFKGILHTILINAVSSESEVEEAKKLITSAGEYALAMEMELARRQIGAPDELAADPAKLKKSLELSAYFTIPKIEVPHRQLALLSAMQFAMKNKNFNTALSFANRIIANGGGSKIIESVSTDLYCRISGLVSHAYCHCSRPRRVRRCARGILTTLWRLSLIISPTSTSALPATRRSTAGHHTRNALSTAPSTTASTRARCAGYAKCVRLASAGVG